MAQKILEFITDDGVKLKEGERYWYVDVLSLRYWSGVVNPFTWHDPDYKHFSTEKLAKEYADSHAA